MLEWNAESPTRQSVYGIPALVAVGMPDAKILIGDFSRLVVLTDSTFDQHAVTQGNASGATTLYSFLNTSVQVPHVDAFHTVTIA